MFVLKETNFGPKLPEDDNNDTVALFATHSDDKAVLRFADAMIQKMAKKRAEGYNGWPDPKLCPADKLNYLLNEHLQKGDPTDVGNFAMMLWNRGERTVKVYGKTHPDDEAVDRFAEAMKERLREKREQGYALWESKMLTSQATLAGRLRKSVAKGKAVDAANYAMMLWNRGESTELLPKEGGTGAGVAGVIKQVLNAWHSAGDTTAMKDAILDLETVYGQIMERADALAKLDKYSACLDWLNSNEDMEPRYEYDDEDENQNAWCVYQRRGNRNDTEFVCVGRAPNLADAIIKAANAVGKPLEL